jgi:hypothetical protein
MYFSSNVMNPFTRALRSPFIGRPRDFLHSDITLESKEYSKWEHVHECLLHPVIYGANLRYLQACHSFTPWTQTYDDAPLTRSISDSCLHSWRSLSVYIPTSEVRTRHQGQVSRAARFPEVFILLKLRTHSRIISWTHSRTISWTQASSANLPPEDFNWVRKFSVHISHKL